MLWICFFLLSPDIIFGQTTELEPVCRRMVGVSKPLECRVTENNKNTDYIPKHCQEVLERGNNPSGMYEIKPNINGKPFMVFCDMEIKKGGWTVIQNRFDGSVDFYKEWRDYKFGFGDLKGEFWIGLENIHHLTDLDVKNELLVELVDRDGTKFNARYTEFAVGPEKVGYILKSLGNYSGTANDSLTIHLNKKFTTQDVDQDNNKDKNCAVMFKGAWWYDECFQSNLNGKLINLPKETGQGLIWYHLYKSYYLLAGSRMLIRPRKFDFKTGISPDHQ